VEETDDMSFWIRDMKTELGITVLMVEHDMTLVNRVSDRVIALNYGRVLAMGAPPRCRRIPMSSLPISAHEDGVMSNPDIILKLSNIESYYGPIMAIRGISLEVPRGKIVTLLGANGAGKTTVLKTISGILDPQKGSIEFKASRSSAWKPTGSCASASAMCPKARGVPVPQCAREPDDGRLSAQGS
jgi:ABC-type branched-subunit amino acid transport system ATPase component